MTIWNFGVAGLLLVAQQELASAGDQADPAKPHAGHMANSEGMTASDPHAHHHHAASGPPASILGSNDPNFSVVLPASSPANGAMLEQSPRTISLTFPMTITIQQIALTTMAGQRVPIAAALPTEPVTSFTSSLVTLDRGTYKLRWRGLNQIREIGGSISFSVG